MGSAMDVHLSDEERRELFKPIVAKRPGGFQSLLGRFCDRTTADGRLSIDEADLERISRYAFDYKGGGWQRRLLNIFKRTLGPSLGRPAS